MLPLLHIGGYEWLDWPLLPDVLFATLLLEGAYLYSVTRLRPQTPDVGRVKRRQIASFTLGVIVLYLAAGSALRPLAFDYLVSMHMLEMVLMTLVAPPLLLLGLPSWLLRIVLLQNPVIARIAHFMTRPLIAIAFFNAVLLFTHLPFFYDIALRYEAVHFVMHVLWVSSALVMWWPVLGSLPELPGLSYPLQMFYLFVQSILPSVMASFLTFSDRVIYPYYANAPRVWGISILEDQQIGGLLMKLIGSMILWTVIAIVFFKWYNREEFEATGALKWNEIEEELQRMGLTKK